MILTNYCYFSWDDNDIVIIIFKVLSVKDILWSIYGWNDIIAEICFDMLQHKQAEWKVGGEGLDKSSIAE